MVKRIGRLLIVCMAIMMLIFALASCKAADSNKETGKQDENKSMNLNGRVIKILADTQEIIPSETPEASWSELYRKVKAVQYSRQKEVEQKYNCKIEWVVRGNASQLEDNFEAPVKAGQYVCDAIALPPSLTLPKYVNSNIIVPLDDFINFDSGLYKDGPSQKISLWNGKHYGIVEFPQVLYGQYLIYNKNIFDAEGLPDPYYMYQKGQWTWSEFLNATIKTTKDLNGDGVTDQWGLESKMYMLFPSMIISNASDYTKEVDGKLQYNLPDDKAIKAIQFISDLKNAHKVIYQLPLSSNPNSDGIFKEGKAAITTEFYLANIITEKGITAGHVFYPKGPDASEYTLFAGNGNFYSIPSTSNNPEKVARVISELFALWDNSKPEHISLDELISFEVNQLILCNNDTELFKSGIEKMVYPALLTSGGPLPYQVYNSAFIKIINDNAPVIPTMESIKTAAQKIIDDEQNAK